MRFQRAATAIAPWVSTVALAMLCAGCYGPDEPTSATAPDSRSGPNGAMILGAVAAPVITVTNEYMDPVTSWSTTALWIPNGVPLTFCWTAEAAPGGAPVSAYRYGWDIIDPDDPNAWDMDWVPYDGSEVCAPTRSFESGFHIFAVEVMDDAGELSRVQVPIFLTFGPSSFDVVPGSCQNKFNIRRNGRVRTAIPGRPGMDVGEIDVSSLNLWIDGNTIEPVETGLRDVTGAVIPAADCACPSSGPDGYDDLIIFFDAADISHMLGPVSNGEERRLSIRGVLDDGHEFKRQDCITIAGNPPGPDEPALFQRDAVIVALERAYNATSYDQVASILDEDFTFFFSEADVKSGDVPFEQWDRDHELAATAALLNVDEPGDGSIRTRPARVPSGEEAGTWGRLKYGFLDGAFGAPTFVLADLRFSEGEDTWIAVSPPDPARYPGEVWYQKSVFYFVYVTMDGVTYIASGYWGSFTVRFSETDGRWRLVRWVDDIEFRALAVDEAGGEARRVRR